MRRVKKISKLSLAKRRCPKIIWHGKKKGKTSEAQAQRSERNLELWRQAVKGDERAKEALISENVPLAIHIANSWQLRLPITDMIFIGREALAKAIAHFNPKKGASFASYSTYWIRQEIEHTLAHAGTVEMTTSAHIKLRQIEASIRRLSQQLGRDPTLEEIIKDVGMGRRQVLTILNSPCKRLTIETQDGEMPVNIIDTMPSPYEALANGDRSIELRRVVDKLPEREAKVVRMKFGLENGKPMTLGEAGKVLGICRERVRQLLFRALRHLRSMIGDKGLNRILSSQV